jgi:hypothetical protein
MNDQTMSDQTMSDQTMNDQTMNHSRTPSPGRLVRATRHRMLITVHITMKINSGSSMTILTQPFRVCARTGSNLLAEMTSKNQPRRGIAIIAQHFSAGKRVQGDQSPGGTTEVLTTIWPAVGTK